MSYTTTVENTPSAPKDFPVHYLDAGCGIGILTSVDQAMHMGPKVGHPVVRAGHTYTFPQTRQYTSTSTGLRCRDLFPGERVVITGDRQ